jgi:putative addiction module component (TIGR02574 family)
MMNLETRKYQLIQELINIDSASIIDALENVLKREKEEHQDITEEHKIELDKRLESYKNNPNNVLDWQDVKHNW